MPFVGFTGCHHFIVKKKKRERKKEKKGRAKGRK
jgi:hypothetical protein